MTQTHDATSHRHLLNGDAVRERFVESKIGASAAPADVHAWSDMLYDGPTSFDFRVPSALERRARWVEHIYGVPADDYKRRHRRDEAWLDASTEVDELTLWFEDDHFCEVNLLYLCARLAAPIFSRVQLSLVLAPGPGGLAHPQLDFDAAHAQRQPLSRAELGRAASAWRAYCDADPRSFLRARMPRFLPDFHARWRGRFPDATGLDCIEASTIEALQLGPRSPAELFREICHAPTSPAHAYGLGDLQYWRVLHALEDRALISFDDVQLLPVHAKSLAAPRDPTQGRVRLGPLHIDSATARVRPGGSDAPVGGAAPSCWLRDELDGA